MMMMMMMMMMVGWGSGCGVGVGGGVVGPFVAGPVARFRELAEDIKNAGRAGERHLPRKAKAWGVEKNMHHARSKALVDKDEVHDNMTMPEDRGVKLRFFF